MSSRIGFFRNGMIPTDVSAPKRNVSMPSGNSGFADIFRAKINESDSLKFSAHAQDRMRDRNINLSAEQMKQLEDAVEKAAHAGSKESLILMDDVSLIVSVKNKTVVTAIDNNSSKDNVFTNIDSAVIV